MTAIPRQWSEREIANDSAASAALFRKSRFAEPLEAWLREVDRRAAEFEQLFDGHDIANPAALTPEDIISIIDAGLLDALRYLPGPPISTDDLKNLADVESLVPSRLRQDPAAAQRVLETIRKTVDPKRFPWLVENRRPTNSERSVAIFASALLHAAQRVQTARRTVAKFDQERAVREHLKSHGFMPQPLKRISSYAQFPKRGVYSEREVQFGPERVDVLARVWDDRMLAVECKVSNSEVNSFKRLNHDTLAKLHKWNTAFGTSNVIPSAILAGVYSPANVTAAQSEGLAIFWSHRIEDLGAFVDATRP